MTYQTWDSLTFAEAIDLAVIQSWSRHLGIPFYANVMESSFCSPNLLSSLTMTGDATQIALRAIEKSRRKHAQQNNELLGRRVYDYDIPFIFGAVLRQSNSWDDLFLVAQQMKETREAQAFRDWAAMAGSDLINFHRYFKDVQGLADELTEGVDGEEIISIRVEFGNRTILELPLQSKRTQELHLVFLKKLFEWNRSIVSIDSELQRVLYSEYPNVQFGKKMLNWTRGCNITKKEARVTLEILPLANELDLLKYSSQEKNTIDQSTVADNKMDKLKKIKILFIASNPSDTVRLRLDEESRSIEKALRQAEFRDMFDIKQHWAVRVTDLQDFLLRHKPDIVHFSGHGSTSSEIILEDNFGNSRPVPPHALSQLFNVLKDNIRCVILNACYSEQQARGIAEHIDCVIGMSKAIGDSAAISFAAAFYQALGYGRDVKTAFDLGCIQIDLENLDEQDTPKLITINSNPKKIVFVDNI